MKKPQEYLHALKALGMSQKSISEALRNDYQCDCDQSTVGRIANGQIIDPKWTLGQSIISLHASKIKPVHSPSPTK